MDNDMNNIHNFANRQLCEYNSIFPNVGALLHHLLFVIGNGYHFYPESGMIVDESGYFINEFPTMTPDEWKIFIEQCCEKERQFCYKGKAFDVDQWLGNCTNFKNLSVSDDDFTEKALYDELKLSQRSRRATAYEWERDIFIRPYPLSKNSSHICQLSENTPKWFLQIALNFSNAWVRFLSEALENNDVWIHDGINLRTTNDADADNTKKQRNMLISVSEKLTKLIEA